MKKKIICAGLILGIGALTACGNKETGTVKQETSTESVSITETTETETESTSETLTAEEEPQEEMTTVYLDAKGSVFDDWEYYKNDYKYENEYDENGNLLKSVRYNPDGSSYVGFECEYDADGNLVNGIYHNADGSVDVKYEYDAAGNEIKNIRYNADGSVDYINENIFDANGNQIKSTYYNADGSIDTEYENEYDADGNEIKSTYYNADGSVDNVYEYQYSSSGLMIKERWTIYDESGFSSLDTTYEYDDRGNMTLSTDGWEEDILSRYRYENTYDEKGNLVKVTEYLDDVLSQEEESEYSEDGIKLKSLMINYSSDGITIDGRQETEYDENGNELKYVCYDADGTIKSLYESEYIEMQIPKKFADRH